ncbi:tRNA (uridine-2'-O-)-methyltransferase trm7 [Exophiala xenobiotica]|uniref:Putative tRNA (cytidine(32)/guanosine(34)-2'-O)-methyltransferase n=1 Tax=Lithohypha guttulata TaxID=1690604 RepID=A0ABR0K0S1_9EURO|nr:tRNA (uridine-2'-O-)-methyltransferase trm7 [Lithohypha guttulata]KAK5317619.1 tRNA (uridine-2'-O-)-methyltransferase trm7 [Exophiala xenobiotica]
MGKSSKDKRDAYYRLAKEQNWRARSAFKLIQIDEQFDLFSYQEPHKCTRVVDLCAAPGSWSQVLSRVLIKGESFGRRAWMEKMQKLADEVRIADQIDEGGETSEEMGRLNLQEEKPQLQPRPNVKIVAIDLQPMAPLEGIIQLQADITHPSTVGRMLSALNPTKSEADFELVDLVISDGAPDVTGLHDLDIHIQSQLLYSALTLAIRVLRPGGKFVAKIFRGKDVDLIYAQLKLLFRRVHIAKPRSSRASSIEAFVVCEDYTPIEGWTPDLGRPVNVPRPASAMTEEEIEALPEQMRVVREDGTVELSFPRREARTLHKDNRWIAPFLACGDLDAYDADATYRLPEGHVSLDPVQPPTAPPYKEAIERRRTEGGMYGKTKNVGGHSSQA